ncbi:gamma-tubulin complex component GCP6 [Aspergillus campestris IBT 28561]|uniref:Spindle pole body component n=1 Tax=Aspergillus campestris (strain IBT 28561) TaxID=1392248 RepID=A0A2I1DG34_ASPC2|nr:gamma-tubulin complex component GCP6 [Aspergillus campestris IBT 28561]PKY08835.1 gamma-tubulin complex component GCP6 [Aspergillus campestris IBT 28561]
MTLGDDHATDPFSSDGLWRISKFTLQSIQPLEPLPWDEKLPDLSGGFFKSPLSLFEDRNHGLHQLDVHGLELFNPDPPPELTTDASSDTHLNLDLDEHEDDEELEHIWALDNLKHEPDTKARLKSWETYTDRTYPEPVSAYFSESGPKGFDAALARQTTSGDKHGTKRVVRNGVFLQALLRLGLGWSSIFFRYNDQDKRFEQVLHGIRVSGVSAAALNGVTNEVLQCGTNMQKPSVMCSFSSAMAVIIYTLERQLARCSTGARSLLQIRALFERRGELVGALANMVEAVEGAASDAQIISIVLERTAHFSQTYSHLEQLFREIVYRISEPFLRHVESWVGFRSETSALNELATTGRSFVALEHHEHSSKAGASKRNEVEYSYRSDQMPSFIPTDQARLIFESGRSLRLLKRSHPQHPIASEGLCDNSPKFECARTWKDIERIQGKAHDYERRLRSEIRKYNRGVVSSHNEVGSSDLGDPQKRDAAIVAGTFELFNIDDRGNTTGLLELQSEKDKIGQLLDNNKNTDTRELEQEVSFGPDLVSSLYLSIAPLLSSQALLIDFSCLHLLFKEHGLRNHLNLQWRFQLLGDGFFTSRLSHSLFDPEMASGERKSGKVRNSVHTGLRLGSRDTWPPASSELRLVLMGILNECYDGGDHSSETESRKERELPGGLNFSIRELTDEEIIKCRDPNAIEALDFLRLHYTPSAVLETILTKRSLTKYDTLFRHVLRLLRMVSVVKGLIRDSTARDSLSGDTRNVFQKFRIDCQHFVLAVSDYSFHVGIGSTWQRFQETLSRIDTCLSRGDIEGTIDAAHSVPSLRDYHEDILDQMLFALFLSPRHADAARLLEGIFGTILVFAPLSRLDGLRGVRHESEATVYRLYATFRKQTSAFVGYLRGLDGAKESSKSGGRFGKMFASREAPAGAFEQLLARLDMKKYY